MTASARNCVLVTPHFGTRQRGYCLHSGYVGHVGNPVVRDASTETAVLVKRIGHLWQNS